MRQSKRFHSLLLNSLEVAKTILNGSRISLKMRRKMKKRKKMVNHLMMILLFNRILNIHFPSPTRK